MNIVGLPFICWGMLLILKQGSAPEILGLLTHSITEVYKLIHVRVHGV